MRDFLKALKPGYEPPTHKTVKTYLMGMYAKAKDDVKACLKDLNVSFTTDTWTSVATQGFITVTAHYIDVNWELVNLVLATREMDCRHTGENIGQCLIDIQNEFSISGVLSVTTDNASNMHSACKAMSVPQVKCFAHTLQLAVNEGLSHQSITNMVMHARKLTAFFSKSVLASNALTNLQEKLDKSKKSPIIDVCTRWNSTYFMIERLMDIKSDLYTVLNAPEFTKHKHLLLKDSHWTIIEQILPLLKVLVETTEVLCVEEYATSSVVYPLVFGLMKNHLASNEFDSGLLRELKSKIADGIQKRLLSDHDGVPFYKSVCMISTVLDPRYKRLRFLTEDQKTGAYDEVKRRLNVKTSPGSEPETNPAPDVSVKIEPGTDATPCIKLEKHSNALQFIMGDIIEIGDDEVTEYCEFDQYMAEPIRSVSLNPLLWWKENQSRFPVLSSLAKTFLTIPATSVPSERVFSAAGLTITKQRSSLDPSVADAIIFMNKYSKSKKTRVISSACVPLPEHQQALLVKQEPLERTQQNPNTEPPLPTLPDI